MSAAMHWLTTAFDGIVAFLPSLIAGLFILAIGLVLAYVFERITRTVLGKVGYDRFLAKLGLIDRDKTESRSGSRWTGRAVFVVTLLAAIMQAARAWHLEMLAVGVGRIIAYVPHLIGATVIFGAALYFANWVYDRLTRRELERRRGDRPADQRSLLAPIVRAAILALGGFMALHELQIASEIVTIAFTCALASIALGAALAFGLGSRGVAAKVTERWYQQRPATNGVTSEQTPRTPGT